MTCIRDAIGDFKELAGMKGLMINGNVMLNYSKVTNNVYGRYISIVYSLKTMC